MSKPTEHQRFWAKVDKTPTCWNWTAHTRGGYGRFRKTASKSLTGAHRYAYEDVVGDIPEGKDVDHLCRNRACVNPAHLRLATPKQNQENRSTSSWGKSRIRGVTWDQSSEMWVARVRHNYVNHFVGKFREIEDAAAAATAKRNELFTHNDLD